MKLLPVALNVEGARVLIVGGGVVASRKAGVLQECGAKIKIVAPVLCAELETIASDLEYSRRAFHSDDCDNCTLIFACTDNAKVNAEISAIARLKNIWCQVADDGAGSTLHSAATVRRGEICIGITTGGGSPALAKHLKMQVENCVGDEYELLLDLMSSKRDAMKAKVESQRERAKAWREILASGVLQTLREGKTSEAEKLIDEFLKRD